MAKSPAAIRVSRRYRASPECVFHAWLDPKVAGQWLFATAARPMSRVAIDARVEGAFRLVDGASAYSGRYLEIVPPRRLAFTLFEGIPPRAETRVRVEIVPMKKGCGLTLIHEDIPPGCAGVIEARWTGILYGLRETLAATDFLPGSKQ